MRTEQKSGRIYYLDAMRSILMMLGVLLHSAVVFSPRDWAIKNPETSIFYGNLVEFIHLFRMPAFFIVSGFFCHMTLSRYGYYQFLRIRLPRILIPLTVTALTLNSLQNILIFYKLQSPIPILSLDYWMQGKWLSHLWFLASTAYYFIAASALYALMPKIIKNISSLITTFFIKTKGLYLLVLAFISLSLLKLSYLISFSDDNQFDLAISDTVKYSAFFIFGALLGSSKQLLNNFTKPNASIVIMTITLYLLSVSELFDALIFTAYVKILASWVACHLCFCIFYRIFNTQSIIFNYFSDASYSIYLFHHILVIAYGSLLTGLNAPIHIKFLLLLLSTFITTTAIHHFIILRSQNLRYLYNGKKR